MAIFNTIRQNKLLAGNIISAFVIRGISLFLSVATLPLYMRYFTNNNVLGIWYTVITMINWTLTFDLGIGNGLRNELTKALAKKDYVTAKKLISSSYMLLGLLALFVCLLFVLISRHINWNNILNVSINEFPRTYLEECVNIIFIGVISSFFLRIINSILYALQYSSANNFIALTNQGLLVAFLFFVTPKESFIDNFRILAYYHSITINITLIIATIVVFTMTELKHCRPSLRKYSSICAKSVLQLGVQFLVAQLLYMVITVTNEWFITKFYSPDKCVDYQIYYKVFYLFFSLYGLALTPLWSAITKAYAEKKYLWLIKLRNMLYLSVLAMAVLQIAVVPFLQTICDVWLGGKSIALDNSYIAIFILFSIVNIWINNISTFSSGMGVLNLAIICYSFAALVKVLGIVFLSDYFDSWIFVIAITIIGLIPYCVAIPWQNNKLINKLKYSTGC